MAAVDRSLYQCRFKQGLGFAFGLAQETNRYLDAKAPWRAIKSESQTDREDAATTLWAAIQVINCLKIVLAPFLPFSSQNLHGFLGLEGKVENDRWDFDAAMEKIIAGGTLNRPVSSVHQA